MSSRSGPHAVTAGGLVKTPPSHSQSSGPGDHSVPVHALWNIEPSSPTPKMSSRSEPQETTFGGWMKVPPSHSHGWSRRQSRWPWSTTSSSRVPPAKT